MLVYICLYVFRPDLIEYNKLTKANPLQSLNNAFNVADQKLGLTPLLEAEGDWKLNMLYFMIAYGVLCIVVDLFCQTCAIFLSVCI